MHIEIEIDCETIFEFTQHLKKITEDVVKETRRLGLNPAEDGLPRNTDLDDDNCYGTHSIDIN